MATVYRTLNALEKRGEVISVHLPQDNTRYEPAGRGHHHHFRCEDCEGVFELSESCPLNAYQGDTLPGGFKVNHHALTYYGICPDCQG